VEHVDEVGGGFASGLPWVIIFIGVTYGGVEMVRHGKGRGAAFNDWVVGGKGEEVKDILAVVAL
jgi:uncharacterized membrane protein